jgi:choline dehydrogenase-like flavoprotein
VTDVTGVLYESHPDSVFSVDNLAPEPPLGLAVSRSGTGVNDLSWDECPESDFKHFHIYRYRASEPAPEEMSPVHATTGTSWSDPVEDGWEYCYALTAVDLAGNESGASEAVTVTGDDIPAVPDAYALYQNAPNPFNPVTTIFYDLPERSHVRLDIFNVKGELIRTLLDSDMPAGSRSVTWKGTDNSGRAVVSGIYFYRFRAADFTRSRKMILLR